MKQIPASIITLVIGVVVTLISLWVGQNHGLLPEQASAQAPLVDGFFNVMVTIATALFLVVEGAILLFVIKYRQRRGDDTDGVPISENFALEVFWTSSLSDWESTALRCSEIWEALHLRVWVIISWLITIPTPQWLRCQGVRWRLQRSLIQKE